MNGAERIAAERHRQIEIEGYGPFHDQDHTADELARAALSYAMPPGSIGRERSARGCPWSWPLSFDSAMWKPGDRLRELEKAGALIAAAIDRHLEEHVAIEPCVPDHYGDRPCGGFGATCECEPTEAMS